MPASPETKRILLIEVDSSLRARSERSFVEAGYQVTSALSLEEAGRHMARRRFDAVVIGLADGGMGPEHVRLLSRQARGTPLLVLCDASRIRAAVQSLRLGAEDYLLRPPDPVELHKRLDRILERHDLDSRIAYFQDELSKKFGFQGIEARSPAMRAVLERVTRVAPMRSTVLIQGESGVGKELVARSIHFNSPRHDQPFIALNCAAISQNLIESELFGHEKGSFTGAHARARGKFEIAHLGTLFLDEIAEMDPATQVKLLRVLEEREFMRVGGDQSIRVDVRVIAATNADLEELVEAGRFRHDLYYRLKVVTLRVPPLRERRSDIPALVHGFVEQLARANALAPKTVSAAALAALMDYRWPGNVRELKNLIESVLVSVGGDTIEREDLPPNMHREPPQPIERGLEPGVTLSDMERELIRRTLEHTGGNRTHSAALLGIGVRTLQRKIAAFALEIPPRRRRSRRAS